MEIALTIRGTDLKLQHGSVASYSLLKVLSFCLILLLFSSLLLSFLIVLCIQLLQLLGAGGAPAPVVEVAA